jgi:hypothetical protein
MMDAEFYRLWVQLTARAAPARRVKVKAGELDDEIWDRLHPSRSVAPMWRGLEQHLARKKAEHER